MVDFVDPKTPIAFKKIFRNNKTILIELLNTVLELENPINDTIEQICFLCDNTVTYI